jgi:hypothetical protein
MVLVAGPLKCGAAADRGALTAIGPDAAAVFGETVSGATAQGKDDPVFDTISCDERELADEIFAVLKIDFQIFRTEEALSEADDLEQFGGVDSVFSVVGDPELELATLGGAACSPAVDEVLSHETHFRDVEVGWNESAIGELDCD